MRKERSLFDLESLKQFLASMETFTETDTLIYVPGGGEPLYHYTDLAGLNGILQRDDLWLTHSRYCNDDEEMIHGQRVVREVIEQHRAAAAAPERLKYLDDLEALVKQPSPEGVYICCFCLEDNLLSQWRGYGANGTGVSVRFNPGEFDIITGADSPHGGLMRLWKVAYMPDEQKPLINHAINYFAGYLGCPPEERPRLAADALQFLIPTFKNEGFSEEKECRLIFSPPPNCAVRPEFRVARGMLVPYYSLHKLSARTLPGGGGPPDPSQPRLLPIKHVRVGPSANKTVNVESVQMLLAEMKCVGVTVDSCAIPFRG
jgi:hypothetical protein